MVLRTDLLIEAKRENIPYYYRMKKKDLEIALKERGLIFITKTPKLKELRIEAKRFQIPQQYRMKKAELENALEERKQEIEKRKKEIDEDINQRNPREYKSAFKSFLKSFRIDGFKQNDYKTYFKSIHKNIIIHLHKENKPIKVRFIILCEFIKTERKGDSIFGKP